MSRRTAFWWCWGCAVLAWAGSGCVNPPLLSEAPPDAIDERLEATISWDGFETDWLVLALFVETNRVRASAGLRPLRPYPRLDDAAQLQASTSAMLGQPSHDNPFRRQRTVYERVLAAGIQPVRVGENVATTPVRVADSRSTTPNDWPWPTYRELAVRVVQQWVNSPPHRAALLSSTFTHLGCGVALTKGPLGGEMVYAVQVFLVPRRERSGGST